MRSLRARRRVGVSASLYVALEPKLSEPCDKGRVKDYEPKGFGSVVDFIVKTAGHLEKRKAKEAEVQAY